MAIGGATGAWHPPRAAAGLYCRRVEGELQGKGRRPILTYIEAQFSLQTHPIPGLFLACSSPVFPDQLPDLGGHAFQPFHGLRLLRVGNDFPDDSLDGLYGRRMVPGMTIWTREIYISHGLEKGHY